jgi:hypothetical protein
MSTATTVKRCVAVDSTRIDARHSPLGLIGTAAPGYHV